MCAALMCVRLWVWLSGKMEISALLPPLPVLPPLSGSLELCLCCPDLVFKYLTPSLYFPLSSHPPSLPPSLPPLLFRFNTSFMRAVRTLGDGLPPLSHPALLSSLFSASLSLHFSLIFSFPIYFSSKKTTV